MKNILFITLISVWSSVAVAEIRFSPLNVARVEGVVGVTHDELRDAISAENQAFSNAVLAVGLNIDTNSVSVLNELAATFDGFPIEGTATTVGGLLVALAAAIAWLKKNKLDKSAVVAPSASATTGQAADAKAVNERFAEQFGHISTIGNLASNADGKADTALNAAGFADEKANNALAAAGAANEALVGKLDKTDVVAPSASATAGQAADAKAVNDALEGKADRASLAPEYSPSAAYPVGSIVYHDGNIYQCKTAIADGGEAWNAAHWELRRLDDFFTESNSLLTGTIDAEVISKGTAPDAHLEAPTDEHLKLILADSSVAYDSAKALPYKLTPAIGDRVVATMTLTAASTDITLPTISANDTTVKDFILDVTNAYAVEGVATDAGINIPRTDFKLVTRDGESLTDVTTVKAGKSAFICFTQKSPVVVDGTTYPCWCVIQIPFGDPS